MVWFYGLVRQNDGKLRVWEIMETEVNGKEVIWGHIGFTSWMIRDFIIVIKDLYGQKKYMKELWSEKYLNIGNRKISKSWKKQIKEMSK